GRRPLTISSTADAIPASPPMRPIICPLNCSRVSSVISSYPNSRAFFSAKRRTMPRRNIGARSIRLSAPSVQLISVVCVCEESDVDIGSFSTGRSLLIEQFLQLLAGLEKRNPLGRYGNRLSSLWIPPFLHSTSAQPKAAEASNLSFIAGFQRISDTIENGVDDHFCLSLRQGGDLLRNFFDDLRLGHIHAPFVSRITTPSLIRLEGHKVFQAHARLHIQLRKHHVEFRVQNFAKGKAAPWLDDLRFPLDPYQLRSQLNGIFQVAQFVDQLCFLGLASCKNSTVGQRLSSPKFERTAFGHRFDKLFVDIIHHGLQQTSFVRAHLPEW